MAFFVILDVDITPRKSWRDVEGFSSDFTDLFGDIDLLIIVLHRDSIGSFRNRLRIPEVMRIIKRSNFFDALLSRIGLLLFGQRTYEIFQRFLSLRGITTRDDVFESLYIT